MDVPFMWGSLRLAPIIMVRRSREIYAQLWLYGHKRKVFYSAFSCLGYGPYVRRSNLANCKFILVPAYRMY